jgi:hypothetical protein
VVVKIKKIPREAFAGQVDSLQSQEAALRDAEMLWKAEQAILIRHMRDLELGLARAGSTIESHARFVVPT